MSTKSERKARKKKEAIESRPLTTIAPAEEGSTAFDLTCAANAHLESIRHAFTHCVCDRALNSIEVADSIVQADIQLSHEDREVSESVYAEANDLEEALFNVFKGHTMGAIFQASVTTAVRTATMLLGESCCELEGDESPFIHNAKSKLIGTREESESPVVN